MIDLSPDLNQQPEQDDITPSAHVGQNAANMQPEVEDAFGFMNSEFLQHLEELVNPSSVCSTEVKHEKPDYS